MKQLLFNLFNRTFGVAFRMIFYTLPREKEFQQGVHYFVNRKFLEDSAEYAIKHFSTALIFNQRNELWKYCIKQSSILELKQNAIVAEFGVYEGLSINYFAEHCPQAQIFGLDSFEGLEEDWYGFSQPQGQFSTQGKLPNVKPNVTLIKGWFEETVPGFVKDLGDTQINLLHMDADTYKPTAYVLNSLSRNISKGTVIIFDEYFGYPNFRLHEFRAWKEFVEKNSVNYNYIAYTEWQVAVKII